MQISLIQCTASLILFADEASNDGQFLFMIYYIHTVPATFQGMHG